MRIVVFEPPRRFAFTWSAPPTLPRVRAQRTLVIIELEPIGERATRLRFTHEGWGEGSEWDAAFKYFDHAWGAVVLPALKYRFEKGPFPWATRPNLPPIADSIAVDLVRKGS